MSDNIFSGNQNQTTDSNQQNSSSVQDTNSFADLLGSIKNERGEPKYRDLPTAIDALRHSQEFIPQLKTEKERLERELAEAKREAERLRAIEETVEKLTSGQQSQTQTQQSSGLDAEAVAQLVTQTLTQREIEVQRKTNISAVVSTLQQSFGDKAEETFYSKAKELGMDSATINQLAATSPQAVLQLFGINKTASNTTQKASAIPNTSSVNTAGLQPPQQTYIGRNSKPVILGATTQELMAEKANASKLVEELHSQGLSTYDLTDPKVFFKHFGNN